MDKSTFFLISDRVRENAARSLRDADDGAVVSISPPVRSTSQNAKLHALLSDLSKSDVKWAGKRRALDEWKMLCVSGHAIATDEKGEVIPGLEGEFVSIRESTAKMGVRRAASLIEYVMCFCVQNGVELKETMRGGFYDDPQNNS